jgi:hypothetical protein
MKAGAWIVISASQSDLEQVFGEVTLAKKSHSDYRQPHETYIYVCRGPKYTMEQARASIYAN